MPKERLRRLPNSQPRVKWSDGASSWSRCSYNGGGDKRSRVGGRCWLQLGPPRVQILPAVLTYLKVRAASCR